MGENHILQYVVPSCASAEEEPGECLYQAVGAVGAMVAPRVPRHREWILKVEDEEGENRILLYVVPSCASAGEEKAEQEEEVEGPRWLDLVSQDPYWKVLLHTMMSPLDSAGFLPGSHHQKRWGQIRASSVELELTAAGAAAAAAGCPA